MICIPGSYLHSQDPIKEILNDISEFPQGEIMLLIGSIALGIFFRNPDKASTLKNVKAKKIVPTRKNNIPFFGLEEL